MTLAIDTQSIHPSTDASLEALQWLHERHHFKNILDMGCGNGILAASAAAIWQAPVLACDISGQALADAAQNIKNNNQEQYVDLLRSDRFLNPMIKKRAPYDLMICNMVAELLVKMAKDVDECLASGGIAVLSGSLAWMVADTKSAYQSLGFEIIHEITRTPWHTLILLKPVVTKASL